MLGFGGVLGVFLAVCLAQAYCVRKRSLKWLIRHFSPTVGVLRLCYARVVPPQSDDGSEMHVLSRAGQGAWFRASDGMRNGSQKSG